MDIGSGSGLISLALAQNNPEAEITAVEIDEAAYIQSIQNFQNSDWSDRIQAVHSSIQDFLKNQKERFDSILCNPPFFKNNADLSGERKTARQDVHLSFGDLIHSVNKLLYTNGKFYCIIPKNRSAEMIYLAREKNLYLQSLISIKGKITSNAKRTILVFSRIFTEDIHQEEIIIYQPNNSHTEQYKSITKNFYLHF